MLVDGRDIGGSRNIVDALESTRCRLADMVMSCSDLLNELAGGGSGRDEPPRKGVNGE
jgi:hypothetical protein